MICILLAVFVGFVFPWAYFTASYNRKTEEKIETDATAVKVTETEKGNNGSIISVLTEEDVTISMDIEDYVVAVVLREMPADFEPDAMMAQAVVARTYALRRHERGSKHAAAAVCTSAACCQGFCSEEEYLANGGAIEAIQKVKNAVSLTEGEVLTYNGSLIEAVYFSCSGGKTEDALAVWGADVPYLQSTESPGEEHATHYTDSVTYSSKEFADRLGFQTAKPAQSWVEEISYTNGGGVDTITICGKEYKGTLIRSKLNLRSTCFMMSTVGDRITVTTKGYGHRVGMSQYGADAMALQGSRYTEILSHYYRGTELIKYDGN